MKKNVYFILKSRKGSPKYRWDSLKLAGDFPTLALAILKLKSYIFEVCSRAEPHGIAQTFKHLASILLVRIRDAEPSENVITKKNQNFKTCNSSFACGDL